MLPGISYEDSGSLVMAVLLLSVFSAVLKPMLVLFALPLVVMSLGLGLLVINALLFSFVSYLVEGFHVEGFGYAFLGALVGFFGYQLAEKFPSLVNIPAALAACRT